MRRILSLVLSVLTLGAVSCAGSNVTDVGVDDFAACVAGDSAQLLDVRTAQEYAEGHLDGALNIDMKQDGFIDAALQTLDKSRPVAVYCRSGRRSATAGGWLEEAGYSVFNMKGGILAWQEAGKPITTDTEPQ